MSRLLKTKNCICCGKEAKIWGGHVLARQKMALGNYIAVKVIAGFCSECHKLTLQGDYESDDDGCYGKYEPEVAGKLVPFIFD